MARPGTLTIFLFVFVREHRAGAHVWYDRYFRHDKPSLPIGGVSELHSWGEGLEGYGVCTAAKAQ
jgi:hypothetical protein